MNLPLFPSRFIFTSFIQNQQIFPNFLLPSVAPFLSDLSVVPNTISSGSPAPPSSWSNPFNLILYYTHYTYRKVKIFFTAYIHTYMMKNNHNNGFPRKAAEKQLQEPFHVLHKLPPGDSPYVRAKYFQLVEKDPEAAIVFFWKAINVGDRVDSALKDMAVVMKQQDRAEEAIEAIHSFRDRCSKQSQESLDNVLIDLYKKCGKLEEQIELLKQKLRLIFQGEAFNGKPTKTARSHGRKFQVTIKQETSRILGNLGWAYMQQTNYAAAEIVYRKAQEIDPDTNKACNLSLCLIKQARCTEARMVLEDVLGGRISGSDEPKSRNRAEELLKEIESSQSVEPASPFSGASLEDAFAEGLDQLMNQWTPFRSRRLPIFEEISPYRDQLAC